MNMNFENKVLDTIEEYKMIDKDKEGIILVALSGGSDSVSLLHCLITHFGKTHKIYAAHMNHGIRGEEADRDEIFCEKLCSEYKIKFFTKKLDIPEIARNNRESLEETARHERYEFLIQVAEKIAKELEKTEDVKIATAHNSDDNTESVILNISRGSGLNGLRGIVPVRGNIIRPMIKCSKYEVSDYIKHYSLEYVTDKTNDEDTYTRNFIRHYVVKNLSEKFPNIHDSVSRMTKLISHDIDFIDSYVAKILSENEITNCINIDLMFSFHEAVQRRILQYMYSYVLNSENRKSKNSLELKHIEIILQEITNRINKKNKTLNMPNEIILEISYENIIFKHKVSKIKNYENDNFAYLKEGDNFPLNFNLKIMLNFINDKNLIKDYKWSENIYNLFNNAMLDSDKIKGVIFVRNRREGDEYTFHNQRKSVKKNYINNKIPKDLRDKLPVFCDNCGILWACGLPVADRVKVGKNTENILKITTDVKI